MERIFSRIFFSFLSPFLLLLVARFYVTCFFLPTIATMLFYAVAASVALLTPFVAAKVNLPSEGCQGNSVLLHFLDFGRAISISITTLQSPQSPHPSNLQDHA
jgi:hypothetical protein